MHQFHGSEPVVIEIVALINDRFDPFAKRVRSDRLTGRRRVTRTLFPKQNTSLMPSSDADRKLVKRIRAGEPDAWQECINLFEGRLLAFARSRLSDRSAAEDIVQETFMGFLKALPNYDENTPLESWLFSIAAHKLIDAMRRSGRRPTVPLMIGDSGGSPAREPTGGARHASSMMRSHEKSYAESAVVETCLRDLIADFKQSAAWERLQCVELIFVLGWANKDVAKRLNITEQAVANHKFFVVAKLKDAARKAHLQNTNLDGMGLDQAVPTTGGFESPLG